MIPLARKRPGGGFGVSKEQYLPYFDRLMSEKGDIIILIYLIIRIFFILVIFVCV